MTTRYDHCRVCLVSTAHSAFDSRIFWKEARSLAAAGYDTWVIARADHDECVEGVHVVAFPTMKRLVRMVFGPLWMWLKCVRVCANAYHVHDPELLFLALVLKWSGRKAFYDAHEDLAAQMSAKSYIRLAWMRSGLAHSWTLVQRLVLPQLDAVVMATPTIAAKTAGRRKCVVRNCVVLALVDGVQPRGTDHPFVVYAGGLTRPRGILELIEAAGLLQGQVRLVLLGQWQEASLEEQCRTLPGWQWTIALGSQPQVIVYAYMKSALAGLCTLQPFPNAVASLPIKAFEYMACDIPMVVSSFDLWREMYSGCALFVDPSSPRAIADAIAWLVDHPTEAHAMGTRGRQLVLEKYSWEAEQVKLIDLYREIVGEPVGKVYPV